MPEPVLITVAPAEAVAVNLPPGTAIRADRLGYPPVFEHHPLPGDETRVVAVLWGTEFDGAWICSYGSVASLRLGHRRHDRKVWHEAANLLRDGGIVRLPHERREYYGRPVRVATAANFEPARCGECFGTHPENPGADGDSCKEHGHWYIDRDHPDGLTAEYESWVGCPAGDCGNGRWVS